MCDYIATGLASRLVDPDGRQHRVQVDKQRLQASWELPSEGWTVNIEQLPKFSYDHLFAHLISNSRTIASNQKSAATKTYQAGAMKHKEAGYRLFKDDHVKRVKFHLGSDNKCFFSALVQASFKTSTNYSVSVCMNKLNGSVVGARCKCKAGAGGCCKHVAALLYCILDYSDCQLTEIPEHKTCTEKPQQWNVAKHIKDGHPVLFSKILFVHHTYGKRKIEEECKRMATRKQYHACPLSLQAVKEEEIRALCTSLESSQKNSPFSKLLRENDCKPLDENFDDSDNDDRTSAETDDHLQNDAIQLESESTDNTHCETNCIPVLDAEEAVFAHISISQEEADKIRTETTQQSETQLWYKERQWRVTDSYFGEVCKMRKSTSPNRLANTIASQCQKPFVPVPCLWGKENEPVAIARYIQHMKMCNKDVTVAQTGLMINTDFPYLGATPDSLIKDISSPDPDGILEIKCPFKYRDVSPTEAAQNKDFYCELNDGTLTLKRRHNYYYQVQGQMAVASRKWCDFVVYSNNEVSVERIAFDEKFWMSMTPTLKDFYIRGLVPILVKRIHS